MDVCQQEESFSLHTGTSQGLFEIHSQLSRGAPQTDRFPSCFCTFLHLFLHFSDCLLLPVRMSEKTYRHRVKPVAPKCNHFTTGWDNHQFCLKCRINKNILCSRDKPCETCTTWSQETWELHEARVKTRQSETPPPVVTRRAISTGGSPIEHVVPPPCPPPPHPPFCQWYSMPPGGMHGPFQGPHTPYWHYPAYQTVVHDSPSCSNTTPAKGLRRSPRLKKAKKDILTLQNLGQKAQSVQVSLANPSQEITTNPFALNSGQQNQSDQLLGLPRPFCDSSQAGSLKSRAVSAEKEMARDYQGTQTLGIITNAESVRRRDYPLPHSRIPVRTPRNLRTDSAVMQPSEVITQQSFGLESETGVIPLRSESDRREQSAARMIRLHNTGHLEVLQTQDPNGTRVKQLVNVGTASQPNLVDLEEFVVSQPQPQPSTSTALPSFAQLEEQMFNKLDQRIHKVLQEFLVRKEDVQETTTQDCVEVESVPESDTAQSEIDSSRLAKWNDAISAIKILCADDLQDSQPTPRKRLRTQTATDEMHQSTGACQTTSVSSHQRGPRYVHEGGHQAIVQDQERCWSTFNRSVP